MTSSKSLKSLSLKMIKSSNSLSHKKRICSLKTTNNGFRNFLKSKRNPRKQMKKKTLISEVRNPSDPSKRSHNPMSQNKNLPRKYLFL